MAEDDDRPSDGDRNSDCDTDPTATIDDRSRVIDSQPSSSGAFPYAGDFGQVSICCTGTGGIHHLTDSDKYLLLTKHFKPGCTFKFPGVPDNHGRNRSFQLSWLQAFPGLVYSPSLNGGFCKYCVLFGKVHDGQPLGVLVSRPLANFRKATEILKDHFVGKDGNGKLSHKRTVADSITFISHMEGKAQPVNIMLDRAMAQQIEENRLKLKSILKTVILCGRQNISLRGHRDDSNSSSTNKGNFLALLEFRADAGDTVLAKHLKTASSRSTYISKTIQN